MRGEGVGHLIDSFAETAQGLEHALTDVVTDLAGAHIIGGLLDATFDLLRDIGVTQLQSGFVDLTGEAVHAFGEFTLDVVALFALPGSTECLSKLLAQGCEFSRQMVHTPLR